MHNCCLISELTGERHSGAHDGGDMLTFTFEVNEIRIETSLPIRDGRGPWACYVDGALAYWVIESFKKEGDKFFIRIPRIAGAGIKLQERVMWNKAKEQELVDAEKRVEELKKQKNLMRNNRINEIASLFGGERGVDPDEVYEFSRELYDMFSRWHREDNS